MTAISYMRDRMFIVVARLPGGLEYRTEFAAIRLRRLYMARSMLVNLRAKSLKSIQIFSMRRILNLAP